MSLRHRHFVTSCQQVLVLGVVCVALTPAAAVVSLELVPEAPPEGAAVGSGGTTPPASMAAYVAAQQQPAVVPTSVVEPVVEEYSLTAPEGARIAPGALATARSRIAPTGESRLRSESRPVSGFGAVGVTWQHGEEIAEEEISVKLRTRDSDGWTGWTRLEYHDEHGPDPDSPEAARARPGTDEMFVGNVDSVQVKLISERPMPPDVKLAVIDPGVAQTNRRELPAIDTSGGDASAEAEPAAAEGADGAPGSLTTSAGQIELARAAYTPKPKIFSRAQWGADERLRNGTPSYHEVHAGFVHHTVNGNDYSRADVPGILRGIYAYHTQARGWSDVGYNFLVDKFGRIWEGRAGGVDRPVVGAHTLGYNDDAFGVSAIGNFDIVQPSRSMVEAFGAILAWKLSLHGVGAGSMEQFVTSRDFKAINGHRDAGSTACPGRYLYAKLPEIRRLAMQAQVGWTGRQLESNLASGERPDLIVRRASDGKGFIIPIWHNKKSRWLTGTKIATGIDLGYANRVMNAGDWNRDGRGDIIARRASDGALFLYRGTGDGTFRSVQKIATGFKSVRMLAAVGDVTGDGWPDLMGQTPGGAMRIYPGKGSRGLKSSYVAYSEVPGIKQIAIGRWGVDGAPDSLVRHGKKLSVYHGNGPGGITGERTLDLDTSPYDWIVGISDVDVVGHPDLVVRRKTSGDLYLIQTTRKRFFKPHLLGRNYDRFDMVG